MTGKTDLNSQNDDYVIDIRKLFLAALLLGLTGIVLPQALGYNELAVVIPLALMAVYTGIGYRRSKNSPFFEQFADSVYYLGFLFTLIALVVSLYYYRGGSVEVESIIANFSLALITTIFGLSVRIYINNFQVDLRSAERQMLEGVEQAAGDFVRKAKTLSMQLELSHDETQRAIQRAMDDAALGIGRATGVIEKHARMSSKALLDHVETINVAVSEAVQSLERDIKAVALPKDIFVRRLQAPLDALQQHLERTHNVVSDLNQEQAGIKSGFREFSQELDRVSGALTASERALSAFNEAMATQNRHTDQFIAAVKRLGPLTETTDRLGGTIATQAEHATAAVDRFAGLLNSLERLPAASEATAAKLSQAGNELAELFTGLASHAEQGRQIGDDLETIAAALAKTRITVKQISDFGLHVTSAFKRLESFNQAIELHTRNLAKLGGLADADIELAKKHQQEMATILKHARTTMAMLNRYFVDSIEYLSDRRQE